MRVLLTNSSLANRTGAELYVLDVARELLRIGHQPVCYSPILGEVAQELRTSMVPVTDQLNNISAVPDVIHGQHHMETLSALLHFPGVPAIQYCHGWHPWQEVPVEFPRIHRYVAISSLVRESLVSEHGIAESRAIILPNFFDGDRFKMRVKPLPAKPKRALAFSNAFDAQAKPIRLACERFGMSLDVVGIGSSNVHSRPEHLLPHYDIVFARGRAAIEAMACGAAVICCGPDGTGPMVTPANLDSLRALNFAIRTSIGPCEPRLIGSQIALYDAHLAGEVSVRIRSEATLRVTVSRLVELYGEAMASGRLVAEPADEARAISGYLRQWSPRFKDWADKAERLDRLAAAKHALQAQSDRFERELWNAKSQLAMNKAEVHGLKAQLADAGGQIVEAQAQCAAMRVEVEEMRNTLTWRIPQAFINWRPFYFLFAKISRLWRRKGPVPQSVPLGASSREPAADRIRTAEIRP